MEYKKYTPPTFSDEELYSSLLEDETCTVMVQCTAENGQVGDWLRHDGLNGRISPIFNDLAPLYEWLHSHGFEGNGTLYKYKKKEVR